MTKINKTNWEEISRILKKIWKEDVKKTDMSFLKKYYEEIIGKKDIFLESAKRFGTPQYILDEEKLRERANLFRNTFLKYIPEAEFFYAFKSNNLPWMLKLLQEMNYKADVAGLFELQLALKIGFDKIIFTGPGKDDKELKVAIANCAKVIINIDNIDELHRIIKLLKNDKDQEKVKISFRINSDNTLMQSWSKFGIDIKDLKRATELAKTCNKLNWIGLQFHSSWNTNPKNYLDNIEIIGDYLEKNFSKDELAGLEFISVGGGFYPEGIAYLSKDTPKGILIEAIRSHFDDYNTYYGFDPLNIINEPVEPIEEFAKQIADSINKNIFNLLKRRISVFFEPGRFISLHASHILLQVISVKGEKSIITDGGVDLVGDYRYDTEFAPIINLNNPSFELRKKIIYGPTCDPNDFWGKIYFGKKIEKGDLLIVINQGAYTSSWAWRFIKPMAAYVSFNGKKIVLVKEKESFEDRFSSSKF